MLPNGCSPCHCPNTTGSASGLSSTPASPSVNPPVTAQENQSSQASPKQKSHFFWKKGDEEKCIASIIHTVKVPSEYNAQSVDEMICRPNSKIP